MILMFIILDKEKEQEKSKKRVTIRTTFCGKAEKTEVMKGILGS